MRAAVRWAIQNTPAMNTLMVGILLVGAFSMYSMRREVFPKFELEILLVTVPYPGASPEEVEEGICQKIEEAVRSIDGIKKQTAIAKEGSGLLVLELEPGVDVQKILAEVRSEIDRIPSFPQLAEDPEIKQVTLREPAIQVGVVGPESTGIESELLLRDVAEQIREELIQLPSVSQANIVGAKEYQIDVEISEETLRRYGLTLQKVASLIREQNVELPAGTIRTHGQDVLVKGKDKGTTGEAIARIPLVTRKDGVVLTVGDLGTVRDAFDDANTSVSLIDGKPGIAISVDRTADEDLLVLTEEVREYVRQKKMPPGYRLVTWQDRSVEVKDRMDLLLSNGAQGLVLVLITLALFLDLRLAFWVSLGIPISFLGAGAVLYYSGQTLNMVSMFAFLMALGIIVDDAIVVGENVYAHRQLGKNYFRAAIDGAVEVIPSVASSVATTIIAFVPLAFVSGVLGKFIAVMPLAMISMLLVSLFESSFILPCHLGHAPSKRSLFERALEYRRGMPTFARRTFGSFVVVLAAVITQLLYPFKKLGGPISSAIHLTDRVLNFVIEWIYLPMLRVMLRHPASSLSVALAILILTAAFVKGGHVPFIIFPKLDSNTIEASVIFPDGTTSQVTAEATQRLEDAIYQINEKYAQQGSPIIKLVRRSVGYTAAITGPGQTQVETGNHRGGVSVELVDTSARSVTSQQIINEWRELSGKFPGAEKVLFGSAEGGPGGTPIEFKLLAKARDAEVLEQAVERCKRKLAEYPGVFDIADDSSPGKWEFQLRIKEDAQAMGVPLAELAQTVRASYYGEEVMRLQRGRHEVKLMVRYPQDDRRSLGNFDQIRVRGTDGAERPLTELADVQVSRGYTEINRVDQLRSITVSADVNEDVANAYEIVQDLRASFVPALLEEHPELSIRWEGQQEQTAESVQSLIIGFLIALVAMFVVLTLEFNSYLQPIMILVIIPFGAVGAVFGHALMGLPLTLFSLFGLIALSGVVVNDAIVLIDFINHRVRDGVPLNEALLDAGRRRLRPVLLTSVTTVAGLAPMLFETSFQAQILIPMAVSMCGGLVLSTTMVLLFVPVFYKVYASVVPTYNQTVDEHEDEVHVAEQPVLAGS